VPPQGVTMRQINRRDFVLGTSAAVRSYVDYLYAIA
jgi:hypothetical protein